MGNKTKNKASIPDLASDDDESIENNECRTTSGDKEKAGVLNKYFSTVFTVEKTIYDKVITNKTECNLFNIDISQDLVTKNLIKTNLR